MNDPAHSCTSKTGCVLVVDDNARVCQMLSVALASAGFWVITACTPEQAHYRLTESRPETLVLNLQRSESDGLNLLRGVRARHELHYMPIAFLSGCDSDDLHWRAIRAGADWFGLRPLSMIELQQHVGRLMRRGRPRLKIIAAHDWPMGADPVTPPGAPPRLPASLARR